MPKLTVNWSTVSDADFLAASNADLARRLNTTHQNVRYQRQRRGLPNEHAPGGWRGESAGAKPAVRLSAPAARHLRALAAAAGVSHSAYILSIPLPATPPPVNGSNGKHR
jgi:hypothetical protein